MILKNLQKEHYVDKIISTHVYNQRTENHNKRLGEIKEENLRLKNTKIGIFQTGIERR